MWWGSSAFGDIKIALDKRLAWGKAFDPSIGGAAMQSDTDYFRKRAREERQAAGSAADERVRLRHIEFAQAYELRVRETESANHKPVFYLVEAA